MKLLALSKEYFACGWNIFDLLIVSASLLDLSFELVGGLSVLRGLRLVSLAWTPQRSRTRRVFVSSHKGNRPRAAAGYAGPFSHTVT